MNSQVIDDVHDKPMFTGALHAVYIFIEMGIWSLFPPCSDIIGHK
jgi:hypothetical protein